MSNSYGALESDMGAHEQAAYDHPCTVIAAAAGDAGYLNWDESPNRRDAPDMPDVPASLVTGVAVGGHR